MDYMREDPYSSHHLGGGGADPYYSGGYPSNTSFDRQSQHSLHSDRNAMNKNYSDIPNGAPYSSSGNLYPADQQYLPPGGSPPRSLTPPEYRGTSTAGMGGGGMDPRESPYHNLPPYGSGGGNYEEYSDQPPYYPDDRGHDPGLVDQMGYLPPSSQSPEPPVQYAEDLHGGYGQRDDSYEGSYQGDGQGNYMGDPYSQDPQGSFQGDPYPQDGQEDGGPRYNGGVHYPEDTYGYQGGPDPGDPMYPADARRDDPYNESYQPQQLQESSFHDPHNVDPYDPNRSPSDQQYDPYHDQDRYSDAPRQRSSLDHAGSQGYPSGNYMDAPAPRPSDSFREDPNYPGDMYAEDPHTSGRFEGLPPVRSDPFSEDPFREQPSRQEELQQRAEDPYYRGSSPGGGPDPVPFDDRGPPYDDRGPPYDDRSPPYDDRGPPYDDRGPPYDDRGPPFDDRVPPYDDRTPTYNDDRGPPYDDRGPPYDDRGPPYNDRGPPYDDRGPPYDDRGPPYDERDGSDPYSQSVPRYPADYPEEDPARRLEQLTLGAPPMEGRRTPSVDGRSHSGLPIRYPDLQEVIDFMNSPDDSIKASAAAHLQHITYMDDSVKAKTRSLGGLRPLIRLLSHELVEVHKNACGALQNLSYGKTNNDNKREIKNEGGIPELIRLLRKTDQEEVKESVTGVLWNLSSCEDLKQCIIEDGLTVLVNHVILRYSGYGGNMGMHSSQMPWMTVNRNTTGILRNVSSAGFDARKRLRECRGLVNALIYILKLAAEDENSNDIDNKVVENTVCILRNLSYRIQEVVDPDFYKKRTLPRQGAKGKAGKGGADGPGCFGNKSNKAKSGSQSKSPNQQNNPSPQLPASSVEYRALWGPDIHTQYSTVLKRCTNPITMEAAAGAIQNLTACDWQPAVESRAMVRKEKGLPLLVDLLSAESDRVVCATATALRNLAIDDKNKDLVGKYAIHQLVSRLPRDNRNNLPDDTICAVVATLYEVVKDNQSFALTLLQENGLRSLMHINTSEGRYLSRTLKFTLTLLKTLWGYKSLHMEYAKQGYGQADFTTSKAYPRQDGSRPPDMSRTPSSSNHTTPYNTLSRPMSGQGYDDNTLTPARMQQMQPRGFYADQDLRAGGHDNYQALNRSNASLHDGRSNDRHNYSRDRIPPEEIPINYTGPGYAPLDEPRPHRTKPPVGGVPLFPNLAPAEPPYGSDDPAAVPEPLYAQVNKGGRRSQRNDGIMLNSGGAGGMEDGGADSWV